MTIAWDNISLSAKARSSTAPTDEGNYAGGIKNVLAFWAQQKYIDTSSSPDINYLRVDTDEYVKISSRDRPQSPLEMDKKYSIIIRIGAATVVPGTIIAAGVGYFVPGAITGIALAITVTLWWVLYRATLKYDRSE